MNRLIITLALCSSGYSLAIVPRSVEGSLIEIETSCSHDLEAENAVTAWPAESCAADTAVLDSLSASTPYPLSCPPNPQNTKCFPIWEQSSLSTPEHWDSIFSNPQPSTQQDDLELRRRDLPAEDPLGYQARSVRLKWPDAMQHAIFYVDAGCQVVEEDVLAEVLAEKQAWHVKRVGTTREQCVILPNERRWASVEFMRRDEWSVFELRRRGEDDGVGGWGWRGLL